ncbi:DUF4181 domain-containing protein [Bacillus sp. KH172YL63]|uniref:DUF4181 domain-containing protein n=1 Tax=Bacillus sp. KH172YL63 TaxID=2709784 RepID=UPI00156469D9|nr:DUF4181 domain-containing protein [Bacillus sp. KH172YL63]
MTWLKFTVMLLLVLAFMSVVKIMLRKFLGIKKKKENIVSHSLLNESQHKVEKWMMRLNGITLITFTFITIDKGDTIHLFLIVFLPLLAVDYVVRAFFEWKQSDYPKEALLTLMEMVVLLAAVFIGYSYWYV